MAHKIYFDRNVCAEDVAYFKQVNILLNNEHMYPQEEKVCVVLSRFSGLQIQWVPPGDPKTKLPDLELHEV